MNCHWWSEWSSFIFSLTLDSSSPILLRLVSRGRQRLLSPVPNHLVRVFCSALFWFVGQSVGHGQTDRFCISATSMRGLMVLSGYDLWLWLWRISSLSSPPQYYYPWPDRHERRGHSDVGCRPDQWWVPLDPACERQRRELHRHWWWHRARERGEISRIALFFTGSEKLYIFKIILIHILSANLVEQDFWLQLSNLQGRCVCVS